MSPPRDRTEGNQVDQDDQPKQAPGADETGLRTPDEDGPHDVPDSEVIEKTLPAKDSTKDSERLAR